MIYGSVCSGVEAATLAWEPLGWKAAWFSEIEAAPSKILAHRYPHVPNLGDMTKLKDHEQYRNTGINLLVGGTPCQSFSIAGLRGGMADDRGNLALEYCRILLDKQPRWFVWENVPGVFSSFTDETSGKDNFHSDLEPGDEYTRDITESSDFATLLTAFRECGYSVAYRVLDSRYFGVPQRRRRVFVVGHLGNDWRPPTAVLFERESLRRDFTPGKEQREETAGTLEVRTGGGGFPESDGAMSNHVVATLDANYGKLQGCSGQDLNHGHSHLIPICFSIMPMNSGKDYKARITDVAQPMMAGGPVGGNQGGDYIVHGTQDPCVSNNEAFSLGRNNGGENVITQPMVRRLTPKECERLQGFPDGYTKVPGVSESAQYACCGNSMTRNVMEWIGQRIEKVNKILKYD